MAVLALNAQAKAVGVKKFEPYFMQRKLMDSAGVHVFSSNYALYGEISARIMATLRRMTCAVEVYSIDEGFCDLTGIKAADLKPLGKRLRETVWREQRIPMGVSIAPTKCLAKLGQVATKKALSEREATMNLSEEISTGAIFILSFSAFCQVSIRCAN